MMDFMIAFSCIERSTIELKLGFKIAFSCKVRLIVELKLGFMIDFMCIFFLGVFCLFSSPWQGKRQCHNSSTS